MSFLHTESAADLTSLTDDFYDHKAELSQNSKLPAGADTTQSSLHVQASSGTGQVITPLSSAIQTTSLGVHSGQGGNSQALVLRSSQPTSVPGVFSDDYMEVTVLAQKRGFVTSQSEAVDMDDDGGSSSLGASKPKKTESRSVLNSPRWLLQTDVLIVSSGHLFGVPQGLNGRSQLRRHTL